MKPKIEPYNREALQSYILTTARYDFNVYEKRILYKIVEIAQCEIQGLRFPRDCKKIQHNLFGFVDITLPISSILANEDDNNHHKVKKSLTSLSQKFIIYEDNAIWEKINLVVFPKIRKFDSNISFTIHPKIWDCILDFSKGFRKIELKTTMNFDSVYAMRFYELLSGQERPITFEIEYLKEMFQIQDKYKLVKDLIKRVVIPAKRELDKHSPYSFEHKINKKGRKYHSITFYPIQIPDNQYPELEKHNLQKQLSPNWILDSQTLRYLKDEYLFKPKEITQWYDLFKEAQQSFDLLNFIAEKRRYTETAKNPKGYLISCLKSELEKHKEADTQPQKTISKKTNKTKQKTENWLDDLAKTKSINK
ncbi:hypothetical protein CAPN004_23200 [Capnocytophaga cynodegmi]|uniref:replication initiation protein n=1 Tax=Capnocytophaga cynodegmi TaxID=28189 RepID=UPI001ACF3E17|nr:replication initiation protein [Capnocytophaga cynodegmi]GIM53291.1 hypothetical protein CAPN004_23200 [Capnocytophaga cynodegmi]